MNVYFSLIISIKASITLENLYLKTQCNKYQVNKRINFLYISFHY